MRGPVLRLEGAWLWRGGRCVCWRACPGPCLTLGRVRSCCGSGRHGSPTAASSEGGEWPRFLVALRSWSLADSTALVKGNLLRQWGRHDAAPRGREAPGMARTGLGFPPKSPPSGGSGPGVGLGRSWAVAGQRWGRQRVIGVGNSPTPIGGFLPQYRSPRAEGRRHPVRCGAGPDAPLATRGKAPRPRQRGAGRSRRAVFPVVCAAAPPTGARARRESLAPIAPGGGR